MLFNQADFAVRCEWGANGVAQLAPTSDAIVIVDVLSFSTCVEIAAARGAIVMPFWGEADALAAFAATHGATVAKHRGEGAGYSLSPASLRTIPAGTRLVLPSPNGSRLSLTTGRIATYAGCLRNARAVAAAAARHGPRVAVIPAGERWPDGTLRPAWEDWIGAGAVAAWLPGTLSAETCAAVAAYRDAQPELRARLQGCASGKELADAGFGIDVELAAEENVSACAPLLREGAYRDRAR
jgi:2-phosphosulfolactate phosphatase